ncbi:heparinase II/III domain-containing protein [Sphingobacterium lumbrici]|uniref:heparinase II/III domain-containing protein n=1 Tax=Sphingobacterium lumbrici TaxID=2559600 RepID=UPI0015E27DB8|nr:heparinase II/III family protein [Sphingobacterium lumbrici]
MFTIESIAHLAKSVSNEQIVKQWPSHPRLLFAKEDEKAVKKQVADNALAKKLYQRLLEEADSLLAMPVQEYVLHQGYIQDMLTVSREQVYRTITLSMAYRMTNDKRYLKKCEVELINVCRFPNWNPVHYLDVAEMTTAVAIGYDWLYADLAKETRQLLVTAIKEKALNLAVQEYENGTSGSWSRRETNWNVVCNTGMVMGALAIAESEPQLAHHIVEKAVTFIPNYLKHFAPDGVCFEGPAYWGYSNSYLSVLLSVLRSNFGQYFGLSDLPGVRQTVTYYLDTTSPAGKIFNFANSSSTYPEINPVYFFFSKQFNQPEAAVAYRNILDNVLKESVLPRRHSVFFFLALAWFDSSIPTSLRPDKTLRVYKGINDIAVFKTDSTKPNSIYLIAKGGDPDAAHQQMDVGTFIVESDGVRWSDDLGSDSYDLPGFWDGKPNGRRWNYFKNSNLSHNTLSIDGKIQYAKGNGKIVDYNDRSDQPYFVIDMTSAYEGQARSVLRTFKHLNNQKISIKDEIELEESSRQVIWNMISSAAIACKGDVAILTKNGKQLRITAKGPQGITFQIKEIPAAIDLKEYAIQGYQLLQVVASGTQNIVLEVELESLPVTSFR